MDEYEKLEEKLKELYEVSLSEMHWSFLVILPF